MICLQQFTDFLVKSAALVKDDMFNSKDKLPNVIVGLQRNYAL